MQDRDLIGYGATPPRVRRPNDARIAISLVVNYEEGATTLRMMNVGLHCRIAGQPGRANGLDRLIAYARGHPNVWFAGRSDIARTWQEQFP